MSELLPMPGVGMERRAAAPSLLTRTAAALSAFRMVFSGYGGGSAGGYRWPGFLGGMLPGSRRDWAKLAGDVTLNSAVAVALGWLADNMAEPDLRITTLKDGQRVPVEGHPMLELLDQPNPHYDWDALAAATTVSYSAHGNAYWLKIFDQARDLAELWFVPWWQISPCWPSDGSQFISHYEYRVNGETHTLSTREVVHHRFGIDPENPRLGVSRLRPLLREVVTDNEAATMEAAVLLNAGIPSVLIVPRDKEVVITETGADTMKRDFRAKYGGDKRGEPMIPSVPVTVERLGLNPQELTLTTIRNIPEARICAALRLPAQVVGLTVGDRTKTFRNYDIARRAAYEDCIMPLGRRLARTIKRQVLTEYERDVSGLEVGFDYSRITALREDQAAIYRRNTVAVSGGWMKVNEARSRAGLPHDPKGDIYLRGGAVDSGGLLGALDGGGG